MEDKIPLITIVYKQSDTLRVDEMNIHWYSSVLFCANNN